MTRRSWLVAVERHAASHTNPHLQKATLILTDPFRSWQLAYTAFGELETYLGRRVDQAELCSFLQRLALEYTFECQDLGPPPSRPFPATKQKHTVLRLPIPIRETYGLLAHCLQQALGQLVPC